MVAGEHRPREQRESDAAGGKDGREPSAQVADLAVLLVEGAQRQLVDAPARLRHRRRDSRSRPRVLRRRRGLLVDGGQVARGGGDVLGAEQRWSAWLAGQPLSCCLRPAAAENFAARLAAIWIVSPVAGLRPARAARSPTLNLPKPAIATSRPATSSPAIASNAASTALVACSPDRPALAATCLASSCLVILCSRVL